MSIARRYRRPAAVVLLSVLMGGCSQPSEDVRLTLCRGLVQELLPAAEAVTWSGHEAVTKGYEGMEMRLRFERADGAGSASCLYDYDEAAGDYSDAHALAEPTSVYLTHPSAMRLNGEVVPADLLAVKVQAAMVRQGLRAVERVKEGIEALPKYPKGTPATGG